MSCKKPTYFVFILSLISVTHSWGILQFNLKKSLLDFIYINQNSTTVFLNLTLNVYSSYLQVEFCCYNFLLH